MNERKVAGSVLIGYSKFIKKKWGNQGLEELVKEKHLAIDALREGMWYHLDNSKLMLEWISRKSNDKIDYVEECGKYAVQNLGVLNYIVRFMDISSMLNRAPDSYKDAFSSGEIIAKIDKDKKFARMIMRGTAYHEFLCRAWMGCYKGMLEATHTKGTVEKTKCELKGDPHCEYEIRWG